MNDYGILIKKLRESRNMTQLELAQKAEIGNGTIGDIERGARKGKQSTLKKISDALELTGEEREKLDNAFLGKNINKAFSKEKTNLIISDEEMILIPVMAKASAGNGYINFSNEPLYNKLIRKNGFNEKCYLIEVVGDSMEPLIQDGSYVVIDPYQTDYIENKIYVVKYDEEMYIKRVILKPESNLMVLKSVNPKYEDIYITADKGDMVQILGRAVKYIFEGNL